MQRQGSTDRKKMSARQMASTTMTAASPHLIPVPKKGDWWARE
jgi:hypothetical protein